MQAVRHQNENILSVERTELRSYLKLVLRIVHEWNCWQESEGHVKQHERKLDGWLQQHERHEQ